MKREERNERKERVQKLFEAWCEKNGREPNPESFIDYDATQGKKLLDHEWAKKEGYYLHLRMQAANIISSWATLEPLKSSGGTTPFAVRLQSKYVVGNKSVWTHKMTDADLRSLISDFEFEIKNKISRQYALAIRGKNISVKFRGQVQGALQNAEEKAFQEVTAAAAEKKAS